MSLSLSSLRLHSSSPSTKSASSDSGWKTSSKATIDHVRFEETKEKIRRLFDKVELSVSAYDTAWVAMVPSQSSPETPCFPECVKWLLDNQHSDGCWGLNPQNCFLRKDSLLSTLACVLALKRWGVGEEHMNKGIQFIELNFASAADEKQHTPTGFDIIFPGLIEYAKYLNLNLPLSLVDLNVMIQRKCREIESHKRKNSKGSKAYLAYISEGMGLSQDWEAVMAYQRKNGSLINSPATTAAALLHKGDSRCLHYLHSLVEEFGNAVPTVYPFDKYVRLCMVDELESLGISRHFKKEIKSVLDETYRCWLQEDEEIHLDLTTCALAFRLLLVSGYDVSSDPLAHLSQEYGFSDPGGGYLKSYDSVLQLFKAAQNDPEESGLVKQNLVTSQFLKEEWSKGSIGEDGYGRFLSEEVDDALQFPFHASLERLAHRRKIERYTLDYTKLLKTSYCSSNISNAEYLRLAVDDFNLCQSIHREELDLLDSWVVDMRLQELKFARQRLAYCYFSAAATLFSPELSDARISWAKNAVLTTVIDDFFDVGGSMEEHTNLIQLIDRCDVNVGAECCSEEVEIVFSALQDTILDIGRKALAFQGREVTKHIVETWLDLLKSMWQEAEWTRNKSVPTVEEYMNNARISFALGPIVLPAVYLVGPKVQEDTIKSPEFNNLFKHMSTIGRLQNDIQGFKRESEEGKLNAVSLRMIHNRSSSSEEEVIRSMMCSVDASRRELLKLVLQGKGSIVPRPCKDLFWNMSKVLHLFYMKNDGFTSHDLMKAVRSVIDEPLSSSEFEQR